MLEPQKLADSLCVITLTVGRGRQKVATLDQESLFFFFKKVVKGDLTYKTTAIIAMFSENICDTHRMCKHHI